MTELRYEDYAVKVDGINNFRELGGYRIGDKTIRRGLLFRGGGLVNASDADIAMLSGKYNLKYVFDFRTDGEVKKSPDRPVPGAKNMWLSTIDPDSEDFAGTNLPSVAYRDLTNYLVSKASDPIVQQIAQKMYISFVDNEYTQLQYAAFLQTIVDLDEGAVYWHCSQGKDRTGLGSAFLLAALGADKDLIMADFMLSERFYRKDFEAGEARMRALGLGDLEVETMRTFVSVNPVSFQAALNMIDKKFGSMDNYLTGPLCMMPADIEKLKKRYLE